MGNETITVVLHASRQCLSRRSQQSFPSIGVIAELSLPLAPAVRIADAQQAYSSIEFSKAGDIPQSLCKQLLCEELHINVCDFPNVENGTGQKERAKMVSTETSGSRSQCRIYFLLGMHPQNPLRALKRCTAQWQSFLPIGK